MLRLDRDQIRLYDDRGRRFDPLARQWVAGESMPSGTPVDAREAARWLQRESGHPCRVPIGLIGPRQASEGQLRIAEEMGRRIAGLGATLLCGGRGGVMEAACRGAALGGGLTVGLLPDDDWRSANPFVAIPIATGIGIARNAIIARASLCLVAVGGGFGTLSEIAFGLQFGTPVLTLAAAPSVEGAVPLADPAEAEARIASLLLALPEAKHAQGGQCPP